VYDDGHTYCRYCTNKTLNNKRGKKSVVCKLCYPNYRRAVNLIYNARRRARQKNLKFDLDIDWAFEKLRIGVCPVTGLKFRSEVKGFKERSEYTPSIDRINPKLGYTKDNCRIVIWWYNIAKQTYSDIEVWHLCDQLVRSFDLKGALSALKKEEIQEETT